MLADSKVTIVTTRESNKVHRNKALVIQQTFEATKKDEIIIEPQILVIAESEVQCFEAIKKVAHIRKSILGYDHGSYYPMKTNKSTAPYSGGGLILFVHHEVSGYLAAVNLATFTPHLSPSQLNQIYEHLNDYWA